MNIQSIFKLSSIVLVATLIMSNALACDSDSQPQPSSQQQSDEPQTD